MATRSTAPKATGWVLGTVVVALVLAAGAWFLAISPVVTRTQESRAQTESIEESNRLLQVKIARLAEQFENIEQYRAELAALRVQIPTDAQLSTYLREVDALAESQGVTVTSVSTAVGQTVTLAEPLVPADTSADGSADDPADDATGTQASAPGTTSTSTQAAEAAALPQAPEGFVAVPMTVTVVGPYADAVAFVDSLQEGAQRLFLVSGFTGQAQDEAEATGGRPATAVGDIEFAVSGYTYVLLDPAVPTTDPTAENPPLPGAAPGKNPLLPVGAAAAGED